jgi:hypothetical protein
MSKLEEFRDTVRELEGCEDISQQPAILSRIGRQGRFLGIDVRNYISVLAQPDPLNPELKTRVVCPKCNKPFKNAHALRAHVGMVHKKEVRNE